jgi:hypothetical protein
VQDPPQCTIVENIVNGISPLIVGVLEPLALQQIGAPLTQLLTQTLLPMTFPGAGATISAPSCVVNNAVQNGACTIQWLQYAMMRTAYRYITGPFNGPGGNNPLGPNLLWNSWQLAPGGNPNRRQNLLVNVSPPQPAPNAMACGRVGMLNPGFGNSDRDGDGVPDACDNCTLVPNRSQRNCNQETELNLGLNVLGVTMLGDACDPNPCAAIGPVTPAIDSNLDAESQSATSFFGAVFTRPVVAAPGQIVSPDNLQVRPPAALRRCVCGRLRNSAFEPDPNDTECRRSRCPRQGQRGGMQLNDGFQATDFLFANRRCINDANEDRCFPRSSQLHIPEVTVSTVAQGRAGREISPQVRTQWDYKGEFIRGKLMLGNEDYAPDYLRTLHLAATPTYLWTRAAATEGTTPAERLRDHYQATRSNLELGGPSQQSLRAAALNRCLLVPALCSPIPINRLRGLANAVLPLDPSRPNVRHQFAVALTLDQAQLSANPQLAGDRGTLDPQFAALAAGLYEVEANRFIALGPSFGDVPPMAGTALAYASDVNGAPMFVAFGGSTANGLSAYLYEGRTTIEQDTVSTRWVRVGVATPVGNDLPGILTGPTARQGAVLRAAADGKTVYLYGGETANGPSHELWKYNAEDRVWTLVTLAALPAATTNVSMALDDTWLTLFGGSRGGTGLSSQLFALQINTGNSGVYTVSVPALQGVATAIHDNVVYAYGGDDGNDVSDMLYEISLENGSLRRSVATGIRATNAAAIGVDPDGTLAILPLNQTQGVTQNAALLGSFTQLRLVSEISEAGESICVGGEQARVGLACQQDATSTAGTFVCAAGTAQCAASQTTSSESSIRADTFALDERFVAYATGEHLALALPSRPAVMVATERLRDDISALALAPEWLFSATDRAVNWHSIEAANDRIPVSGTVETCGEIRSMRVVGSTLYADTHFGIERFAISVNGLERIGDQLFGSDLSDPPGAQMLQRVDRRRAPICRSIATFFRESMRGQHAERTFDITSDNTLWVTQGPLVFAFAQHTDGSLQLRARERLARGPLAIRAIDRRLYVIGSERQQTVYRETLSLDTQTQRIVHLGRHGLEQWIRERPQQQGTLVITSNDRAVELRRAQ